MEYTYIKGTGLKVSRFCLGTMTFGGQTEESESIRMIDCALDRGVNFFDTADTYTGGASENIVGKALQGKRDRAVIATKVNNPRGDWPNMAGYGRKHVIENVEASLKCLRTDYIDVLYLHHPDPYTPAEDVIETMTNLVRSGKIRYWGLSNHSAWKFCSMIHKAREMHAVAPVVTEDMYNVISRKAEEDMVPFLEEYRVGMTVYNPIAAGLLTGKHSRSGPAENTRFALNPGYVKRFFNDTAMDAVDALKTVAEDCGMSLLEFSIQWLMNQPAVDSLILGASKYDHVVQNMALAAETKKLPEDALKKCDEIWETIRKS